MALDSFDFATVSAPYSFDFSVERVGAAVAFDFSVQPAPYSFDFTVATVKDVADTEYAISDDCKTVTVTIPGYSEGAVLTATAFLYGSEIPITASTSTDMDGVATVVFQVAQDGVFEVQVQSETDLATIPVFVTCRGNKCYHKMNNRLNSCCPDTLLASALLRGAAAQFATERFDKVAATFDVLNELCTDCGCGCSC